jgi:cobalamin biosynthesis protein CobW
VLIGEDLDQAALQRAFDAALGVSNAQVPGVAAQQA